MTLVCNVSTTDDVFDTVNGLIISDKYWLHVDASDFLPGDTVFRDKSGSLNTFIAGNDLSSVDMGSSAGMVSTVNPTGALPESTLRTNPLQFDYLGGESLVVMWRGAITPEGSNQVFLGDTVSSGTTGVAFRVDIAGTVTFFIGNPEGGMFSGNSMNVVFDGTPHTFAFVLDGVNNKYLWYIDGVQSTQQYNTFSSGTVRDSKSIDVFTLGSGSFGGTAGLATSTKSLAILRTYEELDYAKVTQAVEKFQTDSSNLVRGL